jgi:hypothetical protein
MIRTELAKQTGFDPAFRRSQDSDFLIRALLGKRYALSDAVLYAYSQGSAASLDRTIDGYRYRMRAHRRHLRNYPVRVARTLAETMLKIATYKAAGMVGLDRRLIERRWSPATSELAGAFDDALATVSSFES